MSTYLRPALLLALLTSAACHPNTPATQATQPSQPARPAVSTSPALPPAVVAGPADTLHLPGGRVVSLRPTTAAAFNQLPNSDLSDLPNDPAAEQLAATQGRVRRQGLDLLLRPTAGAEVRLSSSPDAEFTLQNGKAVRYVYWGSLPTAHQWVVRAWYWEAAGTVLVDQRTGRHVELLGEPAPGPDSRFVLLTSPGLGGGDQANALNLVQIEATGPRRLWQREPTRWEPQQARWAGPGRAVLKVRHLNAQGQMPEDAPETYAELTLPR